MLRSTIFLLTACFCISACESSDNIDGNQGPNLGAAHNDGRNLVGRNHANGSGDESTRMVSVFMQSEPNNGFIPVYADRVVAAEPINVISQVQAHGKAIVQDINTTIVGNSCDELYANYPDLISCEIQEAVQFEYGEVVSTATTDTEGFAALILGDHDKYRVSVQSWSTSEDSKCYWGGSATLEADVTSLGIPVLVFCE